MALLGKKRKAALAQEGLFAPETQYAATPNLPEVIGV